MSEEKSEEKKTPGPEEEGEYRLADEPSDAAEDPPEYELAAGDVVDAEATPAEFLEVEPPPKGPPPPPAAPPVLGAPKTDSGPSHESSEGDEGPIFDSAPPRLQPFEAFKFLVWPLRNGNADDFVIVTFLILVILLGAWFLGQLPLVGGPLQAFIAAGTAVYFFTYLVKAARAAAEGRPTPSSWARAGLSEAGMSQGAQATILLLAYGVPALVVGFSVDSEGPEWWAFPLALLAWAAFPAALLNLAASGRMEAANPVDVWRTAMVNRGLYLRILIPGAIFTTALFVSSGWLSGVWFGVAMWLTLVYTAVAMGLLAYHDELLSRRVAELSGVAGDEPHESKTPGEAP